MYPNGRYVGLKVVPIWALWGQSIYYLGKTRNPKPAERHRSSALSLVVDSKCQARVTSNASHGRGFELGSLFLHDAHVT